MRGVRRGFRWPCCGLKWLSNRLLNHKNIVFLCSTCLDKTINEWRDVSERVSVKTQTETQATEADTQTENVLEETEAQTE